MVVFGLVPVLIASNVWLFYINQQIKTRLIRQKQAVEMPVGVVMAPLAGVDLNGKHVLIHHGVGGHSTLLLVLSPKCNVCNVNWPRWRLLLDSIHSQMIRPVFVDLSGIVDKRYASEHGIPEASLVTQIEPKSIQNYNFGVTPQTIFIGPNGRGVKVWTGSLRDSDLIEISKSLKIRIVNNTSISSLQGGKL